MFCAPEKNSSALCNTKIHRKALTELSDSALNQGGNYATLGNKRKRIHADDGEHGLGVPLIIYPHASSTSGQQLRLVPKILVSRSCLPLAFIDLDASQDEFQTSRLFRAHIEALENTQERYPGQVVIAAKDDGPTLYAIEKAKQGVYTLCKLGSWVTLENFEKIPVTSKKPCRSRIGKEENVSDVWWKAAAIDLDSGTQLGQQSMRKTKDYCKVVRLSMKPPSSLPSFEPATRQDPSESLRLSYEPPLLETRLSDPQPPICLNPPVPSEDLLKGIRIQYLELLYISKTSLAYFVKGPLSRARAATVQSHASRLDANELTNSLRSNILSRTMTDTKYSDTLPKVLQELLEKLPIGIASDDEECNAVTVLGDRLRKSKKRKKVKDGLFPGEEEYIMRWHINQEKTPIEGPEMTRGERTKSRLASQKAREAQLQLILLLETLALETLALETSMADKSDVSKNLGSLSENAENKARPKAKKPMDLTALLDILVERLCIWQATSQVEPNTATTKSHLTASHTKVDISHTSTNDQLKDFCLEVLIPFFAVRLPEICSSICQRFGGTNESSPIRPSLPKSQSTQQIMQRPSTATQSHSRQKPRRTLERVLTDDKIASRRLPTALTRSATDSAVPNIKRESRELSLSAASSQSRMQMPKHYSHREVDLTVASQATETKLQRKAAFEQELKGAIAALKKPNPRLAVKELVESAEQRVAGAITKSRKSKNPILKPLGQGVLVTATPKGNRRKDIFAAPSNLPMTDVWEPPQFEVTTTSSDPCIPSSSVKPKAKKDEGLPRSIPESAVKSLGKLQPTVEQIPSRKWSRLASVSLINQSQVNCEEDELNEESPKLPVLSIEQPSFTRQFTPSRTSSYILSPQQRGIQETPTRKRPPSSKILDELGLAVHDTPVKARPEAKESDDLLSKSEKSLNKLHPAEMSQSIYESLGWDDDII